MAKRKNQEEIRARKAMQFVERTTQALNETPEHVQALFSRGLIPSVRLNPLVQKPETTVRQMRQLGWQGSVIEWCANGYTITAGFEALRDSQLAATGACYLQNVSSWIPVIMLNPQPGEAVLDVCAAPGGKTGHMAALMRNEGFIVANDNSRPRLMKLQANLQRLGVKAEYTLYDATKLASQFDGQLFDRILLDAPCSGEGLINLSDQRTLDTWSVAHIRRLSTLQRQLILNAFRLLRPGGRLVYSTCTLAPEEDEMIIDWLLKKEPTAHTMAVHFQPNGVSNPVTNWNNKVLHRDVSNALRIIPTSGNEAFFACTIEKQYM